MLILPANFSTAAVLFATCLVLMFIGRINLKYIFSLLGIAIAAFGLFILIAYLTGYQGRINTWKARIENFNNGSSDGNYQVEQAKRSVYGADFSTHVFNPIADMFSAGQFNKAAQNVADQLQFTIGAGQTKAVLNRIQNVLEFANDPTIVEVPIKRSGVWER